MTVLLDSTVQRGVVDGRYVVVSSDGHVGPSVRDHLRPYCEQRYLDDDRYARLFAQDRRNLDGWGTERIERRLREFGVPADVVARVLRENDDHDELTAAVAVLEQRLAAPPADERERTKALGLLVRRGYELEVAYDAVRAFERTV